MSDEDGSETFFNLGNIFDKARNPFVVSGHKRIFRQVNVSPTEVWVRITLPGLAFDQVHTTLDTTRRWFLFSGEELNIPVLGPGRILSQIKGRTYEGAIGFNGSRCCFVIGFYTFEMRDGVLTVFIRKKLIKENPCPSCSGTQSEVILLGKNFKTRNRTGKIMKDKNGERFVDYHVLLTEGSGYSLFTKMFKDGGISGRADVAGATRRDFKVWIEKGRFRFRGKFLGRKEFDDWVEYSGDLAIPAALADTDEKPIWVVENGVLRFRIVPGSSQERNFKPVEDMISEVVGDPESLSRFIGSISQLRDKMMSATLSEKAEEEKDSATSGEILNEVTEEPLEEERRLKEWEFSLEDLLNLHLGEVKDEEVALTNDSFEKSGESQLLSCMNKSPESLRKYLMDLLEMRNDLESQFDN